MENKKEIPKPSNPLAFPSFGNDGITLRDFFANSAMQATDLEKYADTFGLNWAENAAEDSYKLADAMLKQREL